MTQGEKDAELGRVVRERSEAEKKLNVNKVHINKIGGYFKQLGKALVDDPESVKEVPDPHSNAPDFREHLDLLDREKILNILDDIRELGNKIGKLDKQYKRLTGSKFPGSS